MAIFVDGTSKKVIKDEALIPHPLVELVPLKEETPENSGDLSLSLYLLLSLSLSLSPSLSPPTGDHSPRKGPVRTKLEGNYVQARKMARTGNQIS